MNKFEFDENKSLSNLQKHGIDFVDAQQLWADVNLLEIPAKTVDEPRFLVIGKIAGKHWAGGSSDTPQQTHQDYLRASRKKGRG